MKIFYNMIPKIIHYCWFGGKEKPEEVKRLIDTWKKYCKGYVIKEWNESNFDINQYAYCRDAYQHKKWAFVSDVARLWALYHEGGIYMDTDVEVLRPLDNLLEHKAFLGFEGTQWIATNIMGAEPENELIGKFLNSYQQREFIKADGSLDQTTNVEEWTRMLTHSYGLILNGEKQQIYNFTVYPSEYFTPYDYLNGKITRTPQTYTIHWFSQSWIGNAKWRTKLSQLFHRLIGTKMK